MASASGLGTDASPHSLSGMRKGSSSSSHSGSSSRSEYMNMGSPREKLLESYFLNLSRFRFEQARERCDHESRSNSGGTNWCDFMNLLSRIATAESYYFSLGFMEKSSLVRLVRKEAQRSCYEMLILELKKVQEVYSLQKGGTDFSWERKLADLLLHIIDFVSARKEMLEFYLSFDHSDGCHLNYERLEDFVKQKSNSFKDSFQHDLLKPVKSLFQKELSVLLELLLIQRYISEWRFLPAIVTIQSCETTLLGWHGMVPLETSVAAERKVHKSIRSRPHTLPPPGVIPYLYKWWCRFHAVLLAKFSLYFHGVLSEHASVYDMKYLSGKLETDYISIFLALIRNTASSCVCLMFNSNGIPDFKGPKYKLPDSPVPALTGINSYPFMICVPHDFDFHHHRANMVSIIMDKAHQLNTSSQHVSQHDEKLHCTYHLMQVDYRVTMVVIVTSSLVSRGSRDRDSKITNWMSDIAMQLRNTHVAAMLRPV